VKAHIDEQAYKRSYFNSIRWDILKNIKAQKQVEMGEEIEARNRKSTWATLMQALSLVQTLHSKMETRKAEITQHRQRMQASNRIKANWKRFKKNCV